ncbi:unnamed protein product [Adineta steineri]|uniref:BHLH domain-containing protein n=1 Tax=Adineta steineri TaxID=433720 RepID=A0A814UU68_9BILA|nr:unnamed protein product [Adineta steineri]CAF1413080.1 unnamed protein product [Adineta steineri]
MKPLTKREFRNENEKRRRDLSTQLIANLKDILLIENTSDADEENTKFDKTSILRQTVTFLEKYQQNIKNKKKLVVPNFQNSTLSSNSILGFSWKPPCDIISIDEWLQLAIESMHCFFLVIKFDLYFHTIVYVSKNIHSYFGYLQDELVNHALLEFILPSNHD